MSGFTVVNVVRTYLRPDNVTPATGDIELRLSDEIADGVNRTIAKGESVLAKLDGAGHISVQVAANDDPTTSPQGSTWLVIERIDGVEFRWPLSVPHNAPDGVLDLAKVAPALSGAAAYGYVTTGQLFALLGGIDGGTPSGSGSVLVDGGTP